MSALEMEQARRKEEQLLTSEARKLWQSIDGRSDSVISKQAQEFYKLPKDVQDDSHCEELSRRDFFKWIGAATALMATACQQRPTRHLVPYVHKPQALTYGVPVWFSSVASNGLGVLVKTREGRPIKLEGNPDHKSNLGGLDAQTQASILNLYNPERLRGPYDSKSNTELSWDEVNERIRAALKAARPGAVRVLTAPIQSPSLQVALDGFTNKYKAKWDRFAPLNYSPIARAHEIVTGVRRIPFLNFEEADVVVSVDADFLGTWLRPVEFTKQFSKRRRIHDGHVNVNQVFVFESMMTNTGISSDYRYPIKASQQLSILLALINELSSQLRFDSGIREAASAYTVNKVSQELQISSEELKRVSSALLAARGRSLIIAGTTGPQALEVQLACIALNEALGNYGRTVVWEREIKVADSSPVAFDSLVADALKSEVDVLILQGVNPIYSRPSSDFKAALAKIPLVISISHELDETAKLSHIALGESHFLEAWGDNESIEGFAAIQQPSIEPIFNTKSFGEMLLAWSESSYSDYRLFVQDVWKKKIGNAGLNFEKWWQDQLRLGFVEVNSGSGGRFSSRWTGSAAFINAASKQNFSAPIELVTYSSIQMGTGEHANNAWLQEIPDAVTKVTWTNFAALSPDLAQKLNVKTADLLSIKSGVHSIELPAFVQPGLRSDVVAVALGYGRESAGSIGSGVGANAFVFAAKSASGEWVLSGQAVEVTKVGRVYPLATTQEHFNLLGRDFDILQKTTLKEFLADPTAAKEGKKIENFSIYGEKEFVYPGHRWGMAIDLNKCTGCQACIVACYSENNVSVVGPDQIRRGRHMAWLRLDLYYEGDVQNPEANFEPMLCQQCEKAPCETVCPVLATVHSSDGLNDMIYNRCVGTRYCANNCPYKVRRFNYFQYSDSLANKIEVSEDNPLAMMLNPDVTVRSRGVMEKCTFCVQRVRKTVDEYKAKGTTDLPDGAIKTACQQSCPADAIEFGDLNNPQHKVSKAAEKAQSFRVLEVLNTRPSIAYLPRVRNKG